MALILVFLDNSLREHSSRLIVPIDGQFCPVFLCRRHGIFVGPDVNPGNGNVEQNKIP